MTSSRLLQVINVASLTGGTGACAWTITRALSDWDHEVIVVNSGRRGALPALADAFGCPVIADRAALQPALDRPRSPDVVMFHNTDGGLIASLRIPKRSRTFYYHHSNFRDCKRAANMCDSMAVVSRYLARQLSANDSDVLYQPVPVPPGVQSRSSNQLPVIGRICTPSPRKWVPADLLGLYDAVSKAFPGRVAFEFVGCPDTLQDPVRHACGGRATFHNAGWLQRSRLWDWAAMMYHNPTLPETYGRTVAEAQLAGCVPIVTNHGGFVEQIEPSRTGFLCSTRDQFVEAVGRVLDGMPVSPLQRAASERSGVIAWRRRFLMRLS